MAMGPHAPRHVLTSLTLGILVVDRTGANVNVSGKATRRRRQSGTVKFEPDVNDFKAANSPYRVTWTVTDGNSDVAWYPNREPELWVVRKP
jgi:hypothetical protein